MYLFYFMHLFKGLQAVLI